VGAPEAVPDTGIERLRQLAEGFLRYVETVSARAEASSIRSGPDMDEPGSASADSTMATAWQHNAYKRPQPIRRRSGHKTSICRVKREQPQAIANPESWLVMKMKGSDIRPPRRSEASIRARVSGASRVGPISQRVCGT